ncbi:hypothetical protein MHU86_6970 [Fragilaria crotonensis]|nr:hypothetical protein MHU86_6970 [Fragilaria crotonensis]
MLTATSQVLWALAMEVITKYEPYCNWWIQLPLREATTIKNLNIAFGYSYFDIISNKEWIEFHVDYWKSRNTEDKGTKQQPPAINDIQIEEKKATTSIRVSTAARPIMIVGQDESVFAQYLLGSKTWVGSKGQRPLLPKLEGNGFMLSAFASREFGFGRDLSIDELVKINTARQGGDRTYIDTTQAAIEILKSTTKPVLTESPFVNTYTLEPTTRDIGIATICIFSLRMLSIACKCCIEFDFMFLFDHSQGHACKRPGGVLNAFQMSMTYGGAQAVMRDTTIMSKDGYLGEHVP